MMIYLYIFDRYLLIVNYFTISVLQTIVFCVYLQTSAEAASFADERVQKTINTGSLNTTSACPDKVTKAGIHLHGDKRLCNVYHECNCTISINSTCVLTRSNLCPIGQVFYNVTNKCESIELIGCDTSYLQWVDAPLNKQKSNQSTSWLLEKENGNLPADDMEASNLPVADINYFVCPSGSNSRYADPYICNIFHVCVTRNDQTYDQPFLCPYSSVFRVIDANTMYCDKRRDTDCVGTAFYRGNDEEIKVQMSPTLLLNYTINKSFCSKNGIFEDAQFCNTYHRCINGIDEQYICENQLLFNPLSTICDYPINVACGKKQLLKRSSYVPTETFTKTEFKSGPVKSASLIHNKLQKQEVFLNNVSVVIHGTKIILNCPIGAKNALIPDAKYCNVFHHCHGGTGNVFICEKGQAFDGHANGPENSGVCNFEEMVNCAGKFILTENGQRLGQPKKKVMQETSNAQPLSGNGNVKSGGSFINNFVMPLNTREETIVGVSFDCRSKPNGHWRDTRYCDVFHACIGGEQRKTYSCAQIGERVYFDEVTKRLTPFFDFFDFFKTQITFLKTI